MSQSLTLRAIPTPTPLASRDMSQQGLEEHRGKIVSEVDAFLVNSYYVPAMDMEMKARGLADWADTLEDWKLDQVIWGLRAWRDENPSTRPNPSHIKALLKSLRGKAEAQRAAAEAAKMPKYKEPESGPRVTAEQAAAILKEAGLGVKRMPTDGD